MLNPKEVEGLTAILQSLSVDKLVAIARTTTKNMIQFETSEEALKAILTYTEKPSDLLRRQKVTKQIIFNYLRSTGTTVSVSAEKQDYVRACLKLWQSQDDIKVGDVLDDQEESCENSSCSSRLQQANASDIQEYQNNTCAILSPEQVENLGMNFLVWFFDSLNKLNNFGSQHFWPDCKLYMVRKIPPNKVTQQQCLQNAESVAQAFCDFIIRDQLYFHPNIAKGAVKCELEQHGLIKIAVSGVVHKSNNCIGIFDLFFGLVQDPAFNCNWKIKIVQLESQVSAAGCIMPNNSISANASPSLPMLV